MDNIMLRTKMLLDKFSVKDIENVLFDLVSAEDNYPREWAKDVLEVYNSVQTSQEYAVAEKMLMAFTGENIKGILNILEDRRIEKVLSEGRM